MTEPLATIVAQIRARRAPAGISTKIVAVDGPGGAGKTTFAERLARELDAAVVHTDDFASWDNPLEWWPRLVEELLEPLARGDTARYRRSRWGDDDDPERWHEVEPAEHLVLEGVSASRDAFRPFLAYSVWVETPRAIRLARGLERDGEQARGLWEQWMAEEDEYVRRERPRERADAVVAGV